MKLSEFLYRHPQNLLAQSPDQEGFCKFLPVFVSANQLLSYYTGIMSS